MASNRHLGRIIALQTLYEQDFRREAGDQAFDVEEVLNRNIARYKGMIDDIEFVRKLVAGVSKQTSDLDITLQPIAPEWPIDQIARMDRAVLRMGLYELENEKDVPPKVVINEAVELAKAFGGENSSKFVNGVLGTALRNMGGDTSEAVASQEKNTAVEKTELKLKPELKSNPKTKAVAKAKPVAKTKKVATAKAKGTK